jgi:DNA invertase Pin-like site-specific DNA recombinase
LQDNSDDMVAKGRSATGLRHGSHTHPECVAWGARRSRLRPEDVMQIRSMAANGLPHRIIADKFQVARTTVVKIARRLSWKRMGD